MKKRDTLRVYRPRNTPVENMTVVFKSSTHNKLVPLANNKRAFKKGLFLEKQESATFKQKEAVMPIKHLKKFLDDRKVAYEIIPHTTQYTAQGVAQVAHISGKEIAKTVIVKLDGKLAMVVIPASAKVDFELLRQQTRAKEALLANEDDFMTIFPDCEIGAMPPFGNLYKIKVYVSNLLGQDEQIAFNAGNHRELIRMKFSDFKRLVKPKMLDVTYALSVI
jgi:Ala-tRNA(Pro) deacylase